MYVYIYIYLTPRFNLKRSWNSSINTLIVVDRNALDHPHCQARGPGQWKVVLTSLSLSGFCLELQTENAVQSVTPSCPSPVSVRLSPQSLLSHSVSADTANKNNHCWIGGRTFLDQLRTEKFPSLPLWWFPIPQEINTTDFYQKGSKGSVSSQFYNNTITLWNQWYLSHTNIQTGTHNVYMIHVIHTHIYIYL